MTAPDDRRSAVCFLLAAAMLSGCGEWQTPARAIATLPQSDATVFNSASRFASPAHPDDRTSWMSPAANAVKELLYISDGSSNDVFVYDYATGAKVGTLAGFDFPLGQCVDAIGNVWITNYHGLSAEEFAHGGKTPVATVKTAGNAVGCSIAPLPQSTVRSQTPRTA